MDSKARASACLRESIGLNSEPDSEDFKKIHEVFDKALRELKAAGAEIVDPIVIPKIKELLAKRSGAPGETEASFKNYYGRSANPPFKTPQDAIAVARTSPRSSSVRRSASSATPTRPSITRVCAPRTS